MRKGVSSVVVLVQALHESEVVRQHAKNIACPSEPGASRLLVPQKVAIGEKANGLREIDQGFHERAKDIS